MVAMEEVQLELEGKVMKAEQSLWDSLKTMSALKSIRKCVHSCNKMSTLYCIIQGVHNNEEGRKRLVSRAIRIFHVLIIERAPQKGGRGRKNTYGE